MIRIKRGVICKKKHKKILRFSSSYISRRKNVYKISKQSILKSFFYSYIDRKLKKRIFKLFWISNINSVLKFYNFNYSFLFFCLKKFFFNFNKKSIFLISLSIFDFLKLISLIFFYYYYL